MVTKTVTAVALCAVLAGCAATDPADDPNDDTRTTTRSNDCFSAERVSGFNVLGRDALLVYSPNRSCAYLVTVRACMNLRSTIRLAFQDRDGRICGFGDDRLLTDSAYDERCLISGVEKLTPERMLIVAPD
ncbi:MAG: DUF6491 family protein, partial [Pseudomonadota bacterium]